MLAMLRGEAHALAVGRGLHVLADVRAVEVERVTAGLPLDDVVRVAGIPLRWSCRRPGTRCPALVAVDEVVTGAADQRLLADAAEQRVLALPSVDRYELVGEGPGSTDRLNPVVPASGLDVDGF